MKRVLLGLIVVTACANVAPGVYADSLLGLVGSSNSGALVTIGSGSAGSSGVVNVGLGGGGGNVVDANVGGGSAPAVTANVSSGGGNGLINANVGNGLATANANIGGGGASGATGRGGLGVDIDIGLGAGHHGGMVPGHGHNGHDGANGRDGSNGTNGIVTIIADIGGAAPVMSRPNGGSGLAATYAPACTNALPSTLMDMFQSSDMGGWNQASSAQLVSVHVCASVRNDMSQVLAATPAYRHMVALSPATPC